MVIRPALQVQLPAMSGAWRLKGNHRLHRHKTKQLHQRVGHHVPERAGMIVISAEMLHAHGFGDGDGHMIDVTTIPHRLEHRIGKSKRQNVLHGFLAQVMINPIDLGFLKAGGGHAVQRAG